ncbi:hypothetical protein V8F20_003429 [Naviculisporaceae sp. PSN 640]
MSSQHCRDACEGRGHPRDNTVHITNLPPDTNELTLLDCIMARQAFGKLYSIHFRNSSSLVSCGQPLKKALLEFLTPEAAKLVHNYINHMGISYRGCPMKASYTNDSSPDTDLPDHPNDSRTLIVSGPSATRVLVVFAPYAAAKKARQILDNYEESVKVVYGRS